MKIIRIFLLYTFLLIGNIGSSQNGFKVGCFAEFESFSNFGSIDTYDQITDGYSPNGHISGIGLDIGFKTFGFTFSKFKLNLDGKGFEKPYEIIESSYDAFPRMWSGKGGSISSVGYLFQGFSYGIYKSFDFDYIGLKICADYGSMKKDDSRAPSVLFSYSYNTKDDFTSRHWAIYDDGNFYSINLEAVRKIWKGINIYVGVGYRTGTFKYVFSEFVKDDLVVSNNLNMMTETKKSFNSIGGKIGVNYIFEIE